jgi:hypothetical protein
MKKIVTLVIAVTSVLAVATPRAHAACITPDKGTKTAAARVIPPNFAGEAQAAAVGANSADPYIVGFWNTTFFVGDTDAVWDQAFEQWHSDGTELAVDNAVPPSLGNVCVGVWKQVGRTIKLLHYTWNWNPDGTKAGTFRLEMTVTVERGGREFAGTYVSDSFDVDGKRIPELHAEGVVSGVRITVD